MTAFGYDSVERLSIEFYISFKCVRGRYAMNIVMCRNYVCLYARVSIHHLSLLSKQVSRMTNKSPYSLVTHTRYAYNRRTLHMTWRDCLTVRIIPYDTHVAEQTMK
jgi:hypothetical protein